MGFEHPWEYDETLERVTARVPERHLDAITALVDSGEYANRSEAIRTAISGLLDSTMTMTANDRNSNDHTHDEPGDTTMHIDSHDEYLIASADGVAISLDSDQLRHVPDDHLEELLDELADQTIETWRSEIDETEPADDRVVADGGGELVVTEFRDKRPEVPILRPGPEIDPGETTAKCAVCGYWGIVPDDAKIKNAEYPRTDAVLSCAECDDGGGKR